MSSPPLRLEKHITIDRSSDTAVVELAAACDLSKQRIKQAMQKGAVWVSRGGKTKRLRRATKTLQAGEILHIYYDEHVLEQIPTAPELLADEGSYSVWFKPYGMLSQGSKWGDHCTITRWAEQFLTPQRPTFVVHRLDRAATGLILIAHEKKSAAALSALFQTRDIEKHYRAIVQGKYPDETQTLTGPIDDKHATSHIHRLGYDEDNNRSLVEVRIETGRKHQIRRHLSESGFPIVGDRLYGLTKKNSEREDLQLTAFTLAFLCPMTGKPRAYQLNDDKLPQLSSMNDL